MEESKEEIIKENTEGIEETEAPEVTEAVRPEKKVWRFGFLKGFILGAAAVIIGIILYSGYIAIPVKGKGTFTLKFPYYSALHGTKDGQPDSVELIRKYNEIRNLIDDHYLYDEDRQIVADSIFTGMLYGLDEDKYSVYYSKETFENEQIRMQGSYVGIGVSIRKSDINGGAEVFGVQYNGPAAEAGIDVGDIIMSADGVDLTALSLDEAVNYIRGEAGTFAELVINRNGETLELRVERRNISDITVRSKVIQNSRIGYLSISAFSNITETAFYEAVDDLVHEKECEGLIIDLRNNGGGDMNVCLRMIDSLLPDKREPEDTVPAGKDSSGKESENRLLLKIEDKNGGGDSFFCEDEWKEDIPMIILVNEDSASASEIFAGVLQCYGVTVVGTKTYGKGIVQSVYKLSDDSAIKFTTDNYLLPDGRHIHGEGIDPDIVVEFEEFDKVTADRVNYAAGEETDLKQDTQFQKAYDILCERLYS
ncbi:MAG: S41 family peptidase [Eubacteriales bacterium]|nr:S41 family peptidase [Eubacteriales bacterium]